ncbi:MAG: response regulator [Calothrix sp. SM1_7_51]|nr:response regulator [Calothrix sp. SM1_7_51]
MPTVKSIRKDKILVVDDIFENLLLLEAVLQSDAYEVNLVEDSQVGLRIVEESPPDLILLDVMMPELDGYEFTRRVRQNKNLQYIPILLITAYDYSSVVVGLDAGADDFIRKPFNQDELHARVRSLLRLKHSIDERDQMANLREDFVSRFTHDLRTPLVASNRVLQLMREGRFFSVTPEMKEMMNTMIGSNQDLLTMVNTLLEVYRHEAGSKTLKLSPCNIERLIYEVAQELKPLAEEKGLALRLALRLALNSLSPENLTGDEEQGVTIIGDRIELRRVLTNLIGNAIKFTDKGSIDILLNSQLNSQENSQEKFISIEIKDTGPGISKQAQEKLFERFRPGKHQGSGSGLGLYLSRYIIEAHQGSIDVESDLGKVVNLLLIYLFI